jgi:hypothetical protein
MPYEQPSDVSIELPPRQERPYQRPPMESQTFIPVRYASKKKDTSTG